MSAEIETFLQDNITCPHCGYVDEDSWETSLNMYDGDSGETECGKCEKKFKFTVDLSTKYNSEKLKKEPA